MYRYNPFVYLAIGMTAFSLVILGGQYFVESILPQIILSQASPPQAANIIRHTGAPPIDLPSANYFEPTHRVDFHFLNIRSQATIFSDVIATLKQDDKITVFEKVDHDWSRVILWPSGVSGYAANRYLKKLVDPSILQVQ